MEIFGRSSHMNRKDAGLPDLLQQDRNGYVTQMILRHCERANLVDQPAMWCCAQTSMFLGEQVRKVRCGFGPDFSWLGAQLQEKDPGLAVWRSYRVPAWRATVHSVAGAGSTLACR